MTDEVAVTPVVPVIPVETAIQKLHDRLTLLEHKAKPVLVHGYLSLKAYLDGYVQKYPVPAAWVSGIVGSGGMYLLRKWFSF